MRGLSEADKERLNEVRDIRTQNNDIWMSILEIALMAAPETTRIILRDINKNDSKVTALLTEIAGE